MTWFIGFFLERSIDEAARAFVFPLEKFLTSNNYCHSLTSIQISIFIFKEEYFLSKTNTLDGSKASISIRAKGKEVSIRRRILYEDFKNASLKEQQSMIANAIKAGVYDLSNYKRLHQDFDTKKLINDVEEFLQQNV